MKTHIQLGKSKNAGIAIVDAEDHRRVIEQGTWSLHATGYVYKKVRVNNKVKTLYLHRFIKGLTYYDGLQVDHIDGNKLNNAKENLRIVKPSENCQNKTKSHGTSKFRGVSKHGDLWVGSVNIPGEKRLRKVFEDEYKAALWCQEQREKHQPFANIDPEIEKRIAQEYEDLRIEMSGEYPNEYTNSEEDWTYEIQTLCQDLGGGQC